MRGRDLDRERSGGQVPFLADPAGDPVLQACQLATPAAIALRLRRKTSGCSLQPDNVIDT